MIGNVSRPHTVTRTAQREIKSHGSLLMSMQKAGSFFTMVVAFSHGSPVTATDVWIFSEMLSFSFSDMLGNAKINGQRRIAF